MLFLLLLALTALISFAFGAPPLAIPLQCAAHPRQNTGCEIQPAANGIYEQSYSGWGHRTDETKAASYSGLAIDGMLSPCEAIGSCAALAGQQRASGFDLHYITNQCLWGCYLYPEPVTYNDFRLREGQVDLAYGYKLR